MKKIFAAAVLAFAGLSGAAQAADYQFIAGANVNSERFKEGNISERDTGYSIEGGVAFNENFEATLGYRKFVDVTAGSITTETSSFFARFRGIHRFDEWYAYGDLGVHSWETKAKSGPSRAKLDKVDLFYGVGAGYQFNDNLAATLGYEMTTFEGADFNAITLGVRYTF